MIYLATPYSHPDPGVRRYRYDLAVAALHDTVLAGVRAYAPIVHWYPVEISHGLPPGHEFWKFHDCHMMDLSVCGVFMKFNGWETSLGMKHEEEYLREKGKSVFWATFNELPWVLKQIKETSSEA